MISSLPFASWELRVNIVEFDVIEQSLVVTGDTHIGGVIIQLVEKLTNIRNDWSDFALWWPEKRIWLKKTKMTLDQYGVQADAVLSFTRIHKTLRVQLPDMQVVDMSLDFSTSVFYVVKQICKEIGIRCHEEMSLLRCSGLSNVKPINNKKEDSFQSTIKSSRAGSVTSSSNTSTLNNSSSNSFKHDKYNKPNPRERSRSLSTDNNESFVGSLIDPQSLILSPFVSIDEYMNRSKIRFKTLFDKTRLNSKWLDSGRSLYEQDLKENNQVQLRFKYYAFYDLNMKLDSVRVNQIYEQAKWSILSEETECTEQELIYFAALQLQVQLQTKSKPFGGSVYLESSRSQENLSVNKLADMAIDEEDDIDAALNKLEKSLDQVDNFSKENSRVDKQTEKKNENENKTMAQSSEIELADYLFLMKPQRYTFKKLKSYYFVLDNSHSLSYYKSKEESRGKPLDKLSLRECEVVPDVNLSAKKYGINLRFPSSDGLVELNLRCPSEESYANWMSAIKLASKAKFISDPTYHTEVKSILSLLSGQNNKKSLPVSDVNLDTDDSAGNVFQATNLLPARMFKKYKQKHLNDRILEAYSTISELDLFESKWRYIKAWQSLPAYGVTYFAVRFKGSRYKEEIIGISSNRLTRLNPDGEAIKSWRFNSMKSWNVNWEIKQFEFLFDEETVIFVCLNCDAKILHEFVGGYIYMSMRSSETLPTQQQQQLNEDMFFRLTEKR